jgi:site-specific DNA-methyltransferase (adenine-specific)
MDVITDSLTIHHGDCYELLPTWPDAAALVTDPPYGIGYAHSGGGLGVSNQRFADRPIHGDDVPFDPAPFLRFAHVLLWGADHFRVRLPEGGTLLAWDKSPHGAGPADSFADCEYAWTNARVKRNVCRYLWKGVACVKAGEENGRRYHPTQKPQGVCAWCLETLRLPAGSLVIDPFMGGGLVRGGVPAQGIALCGRGNRCRALRHGARAAGAGGPSARFGAGLRCLKSRNGNDSAGCGGKGLRARRACVCNTGQRDEP